MKRRHEHAARSGQMGLLLQDQIAVSVKRPNYLPKWLVRISIAWIGVVGTLLSFLQFFSFQLDGGKLLTLAFVVTMVSGILYLRPKIALWTLVSGWLILEIMLLLHGSQWMAGFRMVRQTVVRGIYYKELVFDPLYQVHGWSEMRCAMFFAYTAVAALALCLTYVIVARPRFLAAFCMTFPFLEIGLAFGMRTDGRAVFLLVTFWVAALAMTLAWGGRSRNAARSGFYRVQDVFVAKSSMRFMTAEAVALLMALLVLVLGGVVRAVGNRYTRSARVDAQRVEIRAYVENFTIKDVTGWIQKLDLPFRGNVVSDEVELANRGDLQFQGETMLKVTADQPYAPQSMYLKGMVRSVYTGTGWTVLPKSAYRGTDALWKRLQGCWYEPQCMDYSTALWEMTGNQMSAIDACTSELTVEAMHKELVAYQPYCARPITADATFVQDTAVQFPSYQTYTFRTVASDFEQWAWQSTQNVNTKLYEVSTQSRLSVSEQALQTEYDRFVKNNYLDVPHPEVIASVVAEAIKNESALCSLMEKLVLLRDAIWARADYSLTPPKTAEGADYVQFFLEESHQGYCTHFASAMVLACRAAGIPARYCQGYVVRQSDFLPADGNGVPQFVAEVPDHHAHAWVEVYVSGYGWAPFEATEGIAEAWRTQDIAMQTGTTTMFETQTTVSTSTTASTAETTTTTITTTAATSSSDGTTPSTTPSDGQNATWPFFLLGALVICVLAGGQAMVRWHHRVVETRETSFHSDNPNAVASAGYAFLLQLLAEQGIVQETRSHEAFAVYAGEASADLTEDEMLRVIAIAQEAAFSNETVLAEDAAFIVEQAQHLAESMYNAGNRIQRFRLRWLRHMVR